MKTQVISGIIGGIVGSIISGLVVSSVTAHRDKFGEIECSKLTVIDADGESRVILSTDVWDVRSVKAGVAISGDKKLGGQIHVRGSDGKRGVRLWSAGGSGIVDISGSDGLNTASLDWSGVNLYKLR